MSTNALLKDVTPENAGAQLLGAGVKPGERVTVIVRRRTGSALVSEVGEGLTRMEKLRALMGSGARSHGPLSAEQIDATVRELRGEE